MYFKSLCLPCVKILRFQNIYKNLRKTHKNTLASMATCVTQPPECVRGITELDKKLFEKNVTVPVMNIKDVTISSIMPVIKKYLLKMFHFKAIQTENGTTTIYLNPDSFKTWTDLPEHDKKALEKLSINENNVEMKNLLVTYENYMAYDILKTILPKNEEGSSSFTISGHIVHVNLREHILPFKNIIGQVLYDKVPGCRTVVNKLDMIDNTYRNFKMELLCGENDMIVELKENKCRFKFDFSTVYWNSRLSTEHERIVEMLKPSNVVFDVFAGVGPFSVPAAKKKCKVFANDLNPESYKWLNYNIKANKISTDFIQTSNKDGHDFIRNELKTNLLQHLNTQDIHIIMNLPALAVEFLNTFVHLYDEQELQNITNPPIVHVYCFAKGQDYVSIAKNLVFKNIGGDISSKITNIFKVRTVSSMKEMMRVSFKLDEDILLGKISNKRKFQDS